MKLFCFGLGYTAQNLVKMLSISDYSGTHRKSGKLIFDGTNPLENSKIHLKGVTHLLISIAPTSGQDPVLNFHQNDIIKMPNLKWVGYLSATSIYGDHEGRWVDENTPPNPTDIRGKDRLKAERQWLDLFKHQSIPVHIFRLGGIYGPQRNQLLSIQNNTARKIIKPGHYFSRIHVDDIGGALMSSINKPEGGKCYNIVDDEPTSNADVLNYICNILNIENLKGTPYEEADLSPMLKSFYADNKRVSNEQTKKDLNWQLKFPTYREGYSDILDKLD